MNIATQTLTVHIPLPLSPINQPRQKLIDGLRNICKIHTQQLSDILPVIVVWTVYQDPDTKTCQLATEYRLERLYSNQTNSCLTARYWELWRSNVDFIAYLQQNKSLLHNLQVLQITDLSLPLGYHAYICCLGNDNFPEDYIFLFTYEPLTDQQQEWLRQSAQLLSHYLVMYQERSQQLGKIDSLSEALGRTEHQLRNPLALISLYAENLRLALPNGCLQEQATLIRYTVDEVAKNLKNLLYYGQRAKLQIGQCNLQSIFTECLEGLRPWIEAKKLEICYPKQPMIVAVDRWQIQQVITNLFTNAIHFSPPYGTVKCNWQIYADDILVEISDRGSGISPTDLEEIFQPYYSLRPGGTGLGLAIAQKIIRDHQGNLWAENLPEGGAQFSFTLPRKLPDV